MQTPVWLCVPGDVVFTMGVLCLAAFAFRLIVPERKKLVLAPEH